MTTIENPLPLDPWTASSLLQKAIRRGDTDLAQWAASTLHRQRGASIWRRLVLIAFEDVGIGDLALVEHRWEAIPRSSPSLSLNWPQPQRTGRLITSSAQQFGTLIWMMKGRPSRGSPRPK